MEGLERLGVSSPAAAVRHVLRGDERIAVTGATGWLGMTALDLLDDVLGPEIASRRVTAYASRPRTVHTFAGREVPVHALSELPVVSPSPTHVLHFAFLTRDRLNDLSVGEFTSVNLGITTAVLEAVARHRPRGLVLSSSGAVYGEQGRLKSDLTRDAYGTLKHLDELTFRSAGRDVGASVVIPRVFSVAGARMTKADLYALGSLIMMARSTGRLKIRSPGPVVRSYAGVADVVALSLWLAVSGRDAIFDTGGEIVEIGTLAAAVADEFGLDPAAIDRDLDHQSPIDRYVGDASDWDRLIREAGIQPSPLKDLIRRTSAWLGQGAQRG